MLPVSLLVLASLSFVMVELLPGNPAVAIAGNFASDDEVAAIEAKLELDRPFTERYVDYLGDTARGDLGQSFFTDRPVRDELTNRLPATMELVAASLLVAGLLGLFLGTIGAYFRRTVYDRVSRGMVTLFQSVPDFLLAVLLVFLLYYRFGVAPEPVGQLGLVGASVDRVTGFLLIDSLIAGRLDVFGNYLSHLALPVVALGVV